MTVAAAIAIAAVRIAMFWRAILLFIDPTRLRSAKRLHYPRFFQRYSFGPGLLSLLFDAFLLNPIPEPSACAMLVGVASLLGVMVILFRKRA